MRAQGKSSTTRSGMPTLLLWNEVPNALTNVCFHPYTHREFLQGCSSTNSFITCGWSPRSHFRSFVWVRAMGKNRGGNKRNRLIKETQSVAVLKQSSLDKDAKVGIPSKWQSTVHGGNHPFQKALKQVRGSIVNSFTLTARKSAITAGLRHHWTSLQFIFLWQSCHCPSNWPLSLWSTALCA